MLYVTKVLLYIMYLLMYVYDYDIEIEIEIWFIILKSTQNFSRRKAVTVRKRLYSVTPY